MSIVIVQVGQAGNQIGSEFLKLLYSRASEQRTAYAQYFTPEGKARCVLIDAEPKVIRGVMSKGTSKKFYSDQNWTAEQSGRGNNWAMGYFGPKGENKIHTSELDQVDDPERYTRSLLHKGMELVRKEAEKCVWLNGFIVIHSISGGTGSGLGSRLVEELRHTYPSQYILCVSIAPFLQGETPLQHYNTTLCLATLQKSADAVVLFQNDDMLKFVTRSMSGDATGTKEKSKFARISTDDMNKYIASCLAGLLSPMKQSAKGAGGWSPFQIGDMVTSICPDAAAKFLEVRTAPLVPHASSSSSASSSASSSSAPVQSWESIAENLCDFIPRYDLFQNPIRSLSSQVFIRGSPGHGIDSFLAHHATDVRSILSKHAPHVHWNPFPLDFLVSHSSAPSAADNNSITICSNRSNSASFMDFVLRKSATMFEAGAYLHWYSRYGCQEEDFLNAFETIQSVIETYDELCAPAPQLSSVGSQYRR